MTRFLVTGAGGLLGGAFMRRLAPHGPLGLDREALAPSAAVALAARIASQRPEVVLHCAADTNVEAAEDDPAAAWVANADLPGRLAHACRLHGAHLVHFSSTGCYGAWKAGPYDDDDPLEPTTAHHRAKAAGEQAVRGSGVDHLILRLGWLYGGTPAQRRNFVRARIVEARRGGEMASDPSQRGNPTWVEDVVTQTLVLLDAGLAGTFNAVAGGSATRFEYVQRIVALAGLDTRLVPRRFQRRAPVSPNEAAVNRVLSARGLNRMPAWDEALARYVAQLMAAEAVVPR